MSTSCTFFNFLGDLWTSRKLDELLGSSTTFYKLLGSSKNFSEKCNFLRNSLIFLVILCSGSENKLEVLWSSLKFCQLLECFANFSGVPQTSLKLCHLFKSYVVFSKDLRTSWGVLILLLVYHYYKSLLLIF